MVLVFLIAQWTSFLNPQPIYDMVLQGNNIWAATKGGVAILDKTTGIFTHITNTNGLPSNQVVKTALDRYGNIWLLCSGTNGGGVVVMTPDMSQKRQYSGINGGLPSYNFLSLLIDGDSVWVGMEDSKLWLYDMNGNPFNNTQEGILKNIQPSNQVNDIKKVGNILWFCTNKGIGISNKSLDSFIIYNAKNGLPNDTVYTITMWKDYIWAGTKKGIAKIYKDSIGQDSVKWESVDTNFIVKNFCGTDTALIFACSKGVFKCNFLSTTSSPYLFISPTKITGYDSRVLLFDNNLWIGSAWNGIVKYDGNLYEYKVEGSATNYFVTLTLDLDGSIWATHWGGEPGWCWPKVSNLYQQKEEWNWKLYEFPVPTTTNVLVDKNNVKWVTTANWNDPAELGIAKIFPNDSLEYIKISAPGLANMITASCFDKNGDLWIQCMDAYIRKINHTTNNVDTAFSNTDYTSWASVIAVDNDLNLWVGSVAPSKCLVVFKKDGSLENLLSNEGITFINMQKQPSAVWVGTTSGLYEFKDMQISRHYTTSQLSGIPNDMAVEPTGIWLAIYKLSEYDLGGIRKLDNNGTVSESYTTMDGLVDDNVLGVEFDNTFNDTLNALWAGTKNGLSRFVITSSLPSDTISKQFKVTFSPNPFISSKGYTEIVFRLDSTDFQNGKVNFYTLSGKFLVSKSNNGHSTVSWDTRDASGNLVPSGIYVFAAYPRNKKIQKGKFAIIR